MNEAIDEKNGDRFEAIRRKLFEMRKGLIRESRSEIGQILNVEDKYNGASDDGDIADIASRDALQAAKYSRHLQQLRSVEEALLKIEEGSFGRCDDCDEEISPGRLNAVPFALRCVECQEQHELMSAESEE
jgi:DnaK suppressor protein